MKLGWRLDVDRTVGLHTSEEHQCDLVVGCLVLESAIIHLWQYAHLTSYHFYLKQHDCMLC